MIEKQLVDLQNKQMAVAATLVRRNGELVVDLQKKQREVETAAALVRRNGMLVDVQNKQRVDGATLCTVPSWAVRSSKIAGEDEVRWSNSGELMMIRVNRKHH